jgi:lysophospholipase L1-like esterase
MTRIRLKGAIESVSLVCLSIAISLVFAEILLRLFYPLEIHKFSDYTRVSTPIHLKFSQNLPNVNPEVIVATNKYGFRTLSMSSKSKPSGVIRILCLGASTTISETQSTDDIWCALLEKMLKARSFNVETAAFGASGWSAVDLLDWTVHNALDYHPDLVILLMGINDLTWAGGPGWRPRDIDELLQEDRRPFVHVFFQKCADWLYLCRVMAAAQSRTRNAEKGRTLEWHSEYLPRLRAELLGYPEVPAPTRNPDPIENFSAAMDKLVAYLRGAHVDVLLLGQPVLWSASIGADERKTLWFPVGTASGFVRADPGWLETEMQRYNERQREISIMRGADYLDLDRIIPKDDNHFIDDCHYTDLGNKDVALAILPHLLQILHSRGDVSGYFGGDIAK